MATARRETPPPPAPPAPAAPTPDIVSTAVAEIVRGLAPQLVETVRAALPAIPTSAPPPPTPPAAPELLMHCLNFQATQAGHKYGLISIPEAGHPVVEIFSDAAAWIAAIRSKADQEEHGHYLLPFIGEYTPITAPPHRFLTTKLGPIPLFEIPRMDQLTPAEHGWAGRQPLEPDPVIPPAAAAAVEPASDDDIVDSVASPLGDAPPQDTPVF